MNQVDRLQASTAQMDRSWIFCKSNDSPLPANAPQNSVLVSNLYALDTMTSSSTGVRKASEPLISSSHSVSKMTLQEKEKFTMVFYKRCDPNYPPILAQIECAASASFRIARGNCAALIRPVVDHNGEVIGSVSLEFPKFRSLYDYPFTQEDLIKWNVAESQVARYKREEDDNHPGNIGIFVMEKPDGTSETCLGDLDFDMSYYSLSSQIKGPRIINNGLFAPLPENAFIQTLRDYEDFPNIKDQQPCHWFCNFPSNKNILKDWKLKEEFQKLAVHPTYIEQKWTAFLIECMITPEMHENAMNGCFAKDAETENKRKELMALVKKRCLKNETLLVQSPGFRRFIVRNPKIYEKVEQKLSKNFQHFEFIKHHVKNHFYCLIKKCMAKDLTTILFHIGIHLNKVKGSQETYHRLIHIAHQFHEDTNPFEGAFTQLDMGFQMLGPVIAAESNKEMLHFYDQFKTLINNYRGFTDGLAESPVSIYLKHSNEVNTASPFEQINVSQVIAKELIKWISSKENILRSLQIVRECITEYTPVYEKYNPRSLVRVRGKDLEGLVAKIESSQKEPQHIVEALLTIFESGAWNQAGWLTSASANVLLVNKFANAVLEDFKSSLSPVHLKNNELVQVCFLIQNDKWKIAEHSQTIALEMKKLHPITKKN